MGFGHQEDPGLKNSGVATQLSGNFSEPQLLHLNMELIITPLW